MVVIFVDKNDLNVSLEKNKLSQKISFLKIKAFQGVKRDLSCRLTGGHERDSNNNSRRNHVMNNSLEKSTTSTGSGQRSPLSSASDKSCDEQLLIMQQQQQQQQRPMYMQQQQQQSALGCKNHRLKNENEFLFCFFQASESPDSRHLQSSSSSNLHVKQLKQEQCEFNQMPFDSHTFSNYSPFAINTLMLHQGFGENPAALNAYYASQLPQTAFVPSSSADYYHHSSMYAPQPTAL